MEYPPAYDPGVLVAEVIVALQTRHPTLGETTSDNTPIRLSRTPARIGRSASLLGQNNDYVYRRLLGMSEAELSGYIADGVIS